ncbi:nucleotide-binding protein [Streptomyces sp. IBSNAI002]|uniref:nucleotide-binding protein n=1 Tax=Streptomyces sp. IBSNAI002 TaxID=3457500 RepID=UPI003FD07B6C
MAMSWAFLNLKPGVGKSTTTVFLGQAFYELGYKPLLVDADSGRSSLAAYNRAGGLNWPVIGMDEPDLHRKIPDIDQGVDIVLIDVPQLEDHARIARGAMRYAETWILPVAPSHYEVDRMFEPPRGAPDDSDRSLLRELLEEVQEMRAAPADVAVLLNRTNRSKRTKSGPDADVRGVLETKGFDVLETLIPYNDDKFRQAITPKTPGTNARKLAQELLARRTEKLG